MNSMKRNIINYSPAGHDRYGIPTACQSICTAGTSFRRQGLWQRTTGKRFQTKKTWMKQLYIYMLGGLLTMAAGCNKYLEQEPDNRASLTDPQKVAQLLGTAYTQASYMTFAEAMSDNANDKGSGSPSIVNSDSYAFRDVKDNSQDSPEYYWNASYEAIAAANQALEACEAAENPEAYRAQKGEALICRAFAHFMLVTLYAKPYDPASAANNPGIPYVTEPETVVIRQYTRGTVASVYAQIEKDLLAGLPLIEDRIYSVPRYHFNKAAANAFAARFYLYKKDYEKVLLYAEAAVPDFLPNLRPWNTTYQSLGLNELPLEYQRPTQPANLLLVSCPSRYAYNFNYATYRYGLDPVVRPAVLRNPVQVTGGSWSFLSGAVGAQSNLAIAKLHMRDFAFETPTSDFGLQYGTVNLLTVEELLFNKAEANIYLGHYDDAISDLNLYMSTRLVINGTNGILPGNLPPAYRITQAKVLSYYGSQQGIASGLINLVLAYKRAEFAQEGMRWFDILRYDIPVTHWFIVSGSTATESDVLEAGDKRRQLKIPDAAKLSGITDLNR